MRNRLLFHVRARVYDASSDVEWTPASMYDDAATIDRYDVENLASGVSTLKSATELEFLDMIEALSLRSVLDLGCGAGAFYALLKSAHPDIPYQGYDLSAAQIARARLRLGDCFAVRDAATITTGEFAQYDAIHAYSLFSWMSPSAQIETLRRILDSGAKLLCETGATVPDINFAPTSLFKNFNSGMVDGRTLFTTVSFPFRSELEKLVRGASHGVTFEPREYAITRALNGSARAGGALGDKALLKRKHARFEHVAPFNTTVRLLMAKFSPGEWRPTRNYPQTREEVYREAIGRISAAGAPLDAEVPKRR